MKRVYSATPSYDVAKENNIRNSYKVEPSNTEIRGLGAHSQLREPGPTQEILRPATLSVRSFPRGIFLNGCPSVTATHLPVVFLYERKYLM